MSRVPLLVMRYDVERLWLEAIAGRCPQDVIHDQVRRLVEAADSETPVVNWGLMSLFDLDDARSRPRIAFARVEPEAVATPVERFDVDPAAWTLGYSRRMLSIFRRRYGNPAARAFGQKLLKVGKIEASDISTAIDTER